MTQHAGASAHRGLLSDAETSVSVINAENTIATLYPLDKISACRPFDVAQSGPPIGKVYCKLEAPYLKDGEFHLHRGPDLFCSYVETQRCQASAPQ